jgi:hypothetical protein
MTLKLAACAGTLLLALGLTGCGGDGISSAEAESLRSEVDNVESRLQAMDRELGQIQNRLDSDERDAIAGLRDEIGKANSTLAAISEELVPPRPQPPAGANQGGGLPTTGGGATGGTGGTGGSTQ